MAQPNPFSPGTRSLVEQVRADITSGRLQPGDPLPSLRDLAAQHGLSAATAMRALRPLVTAGWVTALPRQGMIVAHAERREPERYLLVTPADDELSAKAPQIPAIQHGFELQISTLGAASIVLPANDVAEHLESGSLPPVVGIFSWRASRLQPHLFSATARTPHVSASYPPADATSDTIVFDDVDGGRQATRHLIRHGHTSIAYLAFHRETSPAEPFLWSQRRQRGWQDALDAYRGSHASPVLYPQREPADRDDSLVVAQEVADAAMARLDEFTAVVGADIRVLLALSAALESAGIAPENWPAMVGFEDTIESEMNALTCLRADWQQLGQTAATLLVRRHRGDLTGDPVHNEVSMNLIVRLSSRSGWRAELQRPRV